MRLGGADMNGRKCGIFVGFFFRGSFATRSVERGTVEFKENVCKNLFTPLVKKANSGDTLDMYRLLA